MSFQDPKIPDFSKWQCANKDFTLFDYIHALFKEKGIPSDLLIALLKLFWPDFLVEKDCVFLKENFNTGKLDKLIEQGLGQRDLEYWMNLVNLDGFFSEGEGAELFSICSYLGTQLVPIWKAKLNLDFPERQFIVECLVDTDQEEVFMILKQS